MAQSGYTPISIYYSSTASATPTAGNLVNGELAINTNDGKLFYKDSSGVVQTLATKATGSIGGSNTQVQYNNNGVLGGSSNFVFDGTNVGIGTSSPTGKVNIYGSSGSRYLTLDAPTNGGYATFQAGGTAFADIGSYLAITGSGNATDFFLTTRNYPLIFGSNSTERMRINATAPVLCLAGGNTSATGTGIAFPATQSASSDANTLDDYEEGTFTPSLAFGGNSVGITYNASYRLFSYTKIGKLVTITGILFLSNKGSSTGDATITGLPFTTAAGVTGYGGFGAYYEALSYTGYPQMRYDLNGTNLQFTNIVESSAVSTLTNTSFNNNTQIRLCFSYVTD